MANGYINKVQIMGNLGRDPEVRSFQNGGKVCNLRIATTEKWKDRTTGEPRELTEWHSVSVFSEGIIRFIEQYARKGTKVLVEGKLQTRKWQDQNGQDRYSTEIVVNGYKAEFQIIDGWANGDGSSSGSGGGYDGGGYSGGHGGGIDDSDIPF